MSGLSGPVIDDIVAVLAAGPGLQVGRGVAMRDAELGEVRRDAGGIAKREVGVELEPVGGFRQALPGRHGMSSLFEQGFDGIAHALLS